MREFALGTGCFCAFFSGLFSWFGLYRVIKKQPPSCGKMAVRVGYKN